MQWGYKTLPEAKTYILKNVTDTDMKLSFNRSKECSVIIWKCLSGTWGEHKTETLAQTGAFGGKI